MALFTARFCRALALVAAVMTTPAVWAHAHLKAQQPAANATVDASPEALILTFSEGIEPAFSGVTLTGPDGKKRTPARSNARRMMINSWSLRLPRRWRAVSTRCSGTWCRWMAIKPKAATGLA